MKRKFCKITEVEKDRTLSSLQRIKKLELITIDEEEYLQTVVKNIYEFRKDRRSHPDGNFDKQKRFYPSVRETCSCCESIRTPSISWPFSLMKHCRTKKHIQQMVHKNRERFLIGDVALWSDLNKIDFVFPTKTKVKCYCCDNPLIEIVCLVRSLPSSQVMQNSFDSINYQPISLCKNCSTPLVLTTSTNSFFRAVSKIGLDNLPPLKISLFESRSVSFSFFRG